MRVYSDDINLKTAVENHFTAKPPRAQRTYSKNKSHPFGEAIDHSDFNYNPIFLLFTFVS